MSALTDLRSLTRRLDVLLRAAVAQPGDAALLEEARGIATLALEMAGGADAGTDASVPATWELDTMTEAEVTLAFVLGSVERAIRQPEHAPHLLRDALPRIEEVRRHLARAPSH